MTPQWRQPSTSAAGLGGFVALMNEKAADIGMASSRFSNPHGLDEPFHYTTARDMATLTRVALEQSDLRRVGADPASPAHHLEARPPELRAAGAHSSRATTGCWASSKGRMESRPATRIPRAAVWWLPPAGGAAG